MDDGFGIVICVLLVLVGWLVFAYWPATIEYSVINTVHDSCKNNEGIKEIYFDKNIGPSSNFIVTCNDNATFTFAIDEKVK